MNKVIQKGFTLIELVVAMSVLAILVSLAVPSFQTVLNNNRLTSNANEMVSTIQLARIEAVRRNARVVVCRSDAPDTAPVCNAAGGDWPGWLAFVDDGGTKLNPDGSVLTVGTGITNNGILDGNEDVLRVGTFTAPLQLQSSPAISNGLQRIVFRSDGLAYTNAGVNVGNLLNAQFAFCIVTASLPENVRDITIGSGARIGVVRRDAGGACVAPTDT